ncbi:MAG: zinc ribbon domain-containing protein [Candidatus Aureabacteria bacterium]|nr:zinc ribbon domain-containing protein [Candidatus Auribacterota bacterium]
MPVYEYHCDECGHSFSHLARTLSDKAKTCPECGKSRIQKQFSTFGISLSKGHTDPCFQGNCSTSACPTGTCPLE